MSQWTKPTDKYAGLGTEWKTIKRLPRRGAILNSIHVKFPRSKKYESSPHELREISVAEIIGKIGARELETSRTHVRSGAVHKGTKLPVDTHTRRLDALFGHVTSAESVANATLWLDRVKNHMKSEHVPEEDEADKEFLSRFIVTKT